MVVELDTDQPAAYKKLKSVHLQRPGTTALAVMAVTQVQLTAGAGAPRALFTLTDVTTVEAAEALRGATLWLPLAELPPLTGAGQFYYHEVVGFTVIDAVAGELGPVVTFYELPQQDVLAVEHRGFEVLVPVNDAMIQTVDRAARTLHVTLPDGLLAIYTEEVKVKEPRQKKGGKRREPAADADAADAAPAADAPSAA